MLPAAPDGSADLTDMAGRFTWLAKVGGISLRAIAPLIGVSHSYPQWIASGKVTQIGTDIAVAICRVFGVSLDWLVNGVGDAPDPAAVAAAVEAARAAEANGGAAA